MTKSIVISGPPAVGKTTVAKGLAKEFNLQYLSGGDVLKEMAKEQGFDSDGDDEMGECKLTFNLSEEGSITVGEETCWRYHGTRASLGGIYSKQGTLQVAAYAGVIEIYKQEVEKRPDEADAHFYLGCIYDELGKYQEAIESFKQAIRIDPDYADAHINLGVAYLLLNDRDSALEQYEILKTLDSERANKLYNFLYK